MRALHLSLIAVTCALALAGCKKKPEAESAVTTPPTAAAPAPAATKTPAVAPADLTDEQRAMAKKQALLDYATMEDRYINDPKAQWATAARASSSFNDDLEKVKADPKASRAWRATGPIDNYEWTQAQQDVGMDWLELGYAKPVQATEVRVVMLHNPAVEAITKVEVIDEAGAATTVWSGISEAKPDERGSRTWFVRSFPKTATKIHAVKLTFANSVSSGYKEIDAVQLVGE